MTVCYFGIYKPNYSRNRILIKGLRENGVKVIECRTDLAGLKKYIDLIKKHWLIGKNYDAMVVGFPGWQAMILARFLTRKKIIFDAFASIYDSMIFDRRIVKKYSLKIFYFWFLDRLSCLLADIILLDTNEHIKYFVKTFKINKKKFVRIFVGADDEQIYLKREEIKRDYFLVHFHGSYIPLQGVEYIINAAMLLKNKNIKFRIIGTKIKEKYGKLNFKNIQFLDNVPYEELGKYIMESDIALGIFGDTEKAKRVVPNKVYEALATGVAVITGESEAAKELLFNRKNVLFCKMADSEDLVEKILELKEDATLRKNIAYNGYKLFKEKATPKILAQVLFGALSKNYV